MVSVKAHFRSQINERRSIIVNPEPIILARVFFQIFERNPFPIVVLGITNANLNLVIILSEREHQDSSVFIIFEKNVYNVVLVTGDGLIHARAKCSQQ